MIFYTGVVESNKDPLKLGRCRVRIHGMHTTDKKLLPTNKLPWAELLIPATFGGGSSGVGLSATGILEGTSVMVIFKDQWNQEPVILGILQGAPQAQKTPSPTEATIINKGTATTPPPANMTTSNIADLQPGTATGVVGGACSFTISQVGVKMIERFEGLATKAYYDVNGYAIGYGSHFANGKAVVAGQTCTQAQAEEYLIQFVQSDIVSTICSNVKVNITQQMFDALCSLLYNIGAPRLHSSTVLAKLNSGDYKGAAEHFLDWNKSGGAFNPTLYARRQSEAQYFLSGGIPS